MKKILMTLAASAALVGFAGQDDLLVTLSAKEKLMYQGKDGQEGLPVNNEVVALVWTPSGATFGGFRADGSFNDGDKSVSLARIVVKDGLFETTTFQIAAELAEQMKLSKGTFALYLLDTRDASGRTVVDNGATDLAQATIPVNYTAKILEGSADSASGGIATSIESDGSESGKIVAEGQTELPVDIEKLAPIIKSVKVEDGTFVVTIEQAVPYMGYGLAVGTTPTKTDMKPVGEPVSGDTKEIVLKYPIDPNQPAAFIQATAGRNQ